MKRMLHLFLMLALMPCFLCSNVVSAAYKEPAGINWVSVNNSSVSLDITGNRAACKIMVTGNSKAKSINGTLVLSLVKTDGKTVTVSSWNVSGSKTINAKYSATVPESGLYQLSFSGTVTMTDGKTEYISAFTTKSK